MFLTSTPNSTVPTDPQIMFTIRPGKRIPHQQFRLMRLREYDATNIIRVHGIARMYMNARATSPAQSLVWC